MKKKINKKKEKNKKLIRSHSNKWIIIIISIITIYRLSVNN